MKLFDNPDMQRKFEATLASIEKDFGKGTTFIAGDEKIPNIPRISTGSYKLDLITGGGYPVGRIVEIYGPESSGKTTVMLHAIAEVQKTGKLAVFLDAEHALDLNYARSLGVDTKRLIVSQPDSAEDTLQVAERWIKSGLVGAVVIDSVASLVPKVELEGEIGDNHIGLLARLMSQALRKLAGLANRESVIVFFVNQIREKVGVMFGNPETQSGGRALKFYASIRLDIRPKEIHKKDGENVSRTSKIKTVKNKVAPPFKEADVDIEFGTGISKEGEMLDLGEDLGIVQKNGSWYAFNGTRLGQGRENAKQFLSDNKEVFDEIEKILITYLNPVEVAEYDEEPVVDGGDE